MSYQNTEKKFISPKNTINFVAKNREQIKLLKPKPILKDYILNTNRSSVTKSSKPNALMKPLKNFTKDSRISSSKRASPHKSTDNFFDCIESPRDLFQPTMEEAETESDLISKSTSTCFSKYWNFQEKCEQTLFNNSNPSSDLIISKQLEIQKSTSTSQSPKRNTITHDDKCLQCDFSSNKKFRPKTMINQPITSTDPSCDISKNNKCIQCNSDLIEISQSCKSVQTKQFHHNFNPFENSEESRCSSSEIVFLK